MKITNTQNGALTISGVDIAGGKSIDATPAQYAAIKEAAPWAFDAGWLVADEPKKTEKK